MESLLFLRPEEGEKIEDKESGKSGRNLQTERIMRLRSIIPEEKLSAFVIQTHILPYIKYALFVLQYFGKKLPH